MSAVAGWHSIPSSGRGRPELRLVPPVADSATVRLTRRGRFVVLVMVGLLIAGVVVGVGAGVRDGRGTAGSAPGGGAGVVTGSQRVVVVAAGQTLSEIAVTELPALPMTEAVVRIQLANDMNSTHVRAGQRVVIPAVP
ncbi:MAG: peptidoglycan-binding protein [Actinomycetales bacterium]|nr:MAG: peptidoglycan-binding protein [Actinomycetales bacterium]